jgi:hypothetical protein
MKSILKSFSEHGTFVQPDALKYILSKEKPEEFTSFIIKNLKEYPLVLAVDQIKNIEHSTKIEEKPEPPPMDSLEEKELQKKMLSNIYGDMSQPKISSEESDLEYDDPDKEDQINIIDEETEDVVMPHVIKIQGI